MMWYTCLSASSISRRFVVQGLGTCGVYGTISLLLLACVSVTLVCADDEHRPLPNNGILGEFTATLVSIYTVVNILYTLYINVFIYYIHLLMTACWLIRYYDSYDSF